MKRFILILFLLSLLSAQLLWGQAVNVPIEHWIYDFIDRMEIRGMFRSVATKSYPLTRNDIAALLAEIDARRTELSVVETER